MVILPPGDAVATGAARDAGGIIRWPCQSFQGRLLVLSPKKGADTLIWLIQGTPGKDWTPGECYARRKPGQTAPQAKPEVAGRLCEVSEDLIVRSMDRKG